MPQTEGSDWVSALGRAISLSSNRDRLNIKRYLDQSKLIETINPFGIDKFFFATSVSTLPHGLTNCALKLVLRDIEANVADCR